MRHHSNRPPVTSPPPESGVEDMPLDPADMPDDARSPLEDPALVTVPDPLRVSGHEGFRPGPFDHERLDAYRIARAALVAGELVAHNLALEHAGLASELRRALVSAQLGVAHAASRGGSDRGARFRAARAEVARAAAALDAALALALVDNAVIEPPLTLLGRLSAMLVRLAARAESDR